MTRTRPPRSPVSPIFLALVAAAIVGGALTLLPATAAVVGGTVLLVMAGWAVSLCLHEFGHAATAYRCGDHSVVGLGYLTLDPRRYVNAAYTILLPLLILLIGGIPLPGGAVWIQRGALRSRLAQSAVSLAGPLVNLVLAVLLTLVVVQVPMPNPLAAGLSVLALIQIIAFVINLIPIPGLDGYGVLDPFLPYRVRLGASRIAPYGPLALMVALFFLPGASQVVFLPAYTVFAAVGGDAELAAQGFSTFLSLVRGG